MAGDKRVSPPGVPTARQARTGVPSTFQSELAELGIALALVSLDDLMVQAVTEAGRRLLGLPSDRIIGRPVTEFIDPADRPAARAAMAALQAGAIDFYQAHRTAVGNAHPMTGFCAWVRSVTLAESRYALIRWAHGAGASESWPTAPDVIARASAVAITDDKGIAREASVELGPLVELSVNDLLGRRIVPTAELRRLIDLTGTGSEMGGGISVAYPIHIPRRRGGAIELEAVAGALVGAGTARSWIVGLMRLEGQATSNREAELESHLWRIAAEIEASGILLRAGSVPGLVLARIPEAAALSPRQWEVLRRILAGQRVPTIARELFVSQSTVRNHLSAIFDRFGVHSQPELLARLTETDDSSRSTDELTIA